MCITGYDCKTYQDKGKAPMLLVQRKGLSLKNAFRASGSCAVHWDTLKFTLSHWPDACSDHLGNYLFVLRVLEKCR